MEDNGGRERAGESKLAEWTAVDREAGIPRVGSFSALAGLFSGSSIPNSAIRNPKFFPMPAPSEHPRDPLHGLTLEKILTTLVERHGWETLAERIRIRCFQNDPSIKSSLTFLRKTPWAREKVEAWYLYDLRRAKREGKQP
jgi:hypothetical protein